MWFPPKFGSPRYIAAARALLAAGALGLTSFYSRPAWNSLYYLFQWVFLAWAVVLAGRSHWQKGPLALLALFGDMVYFLLFAGNPADPMLWLASFLLLYLLAEAVVLFGPVEVAVTALVSGIFCAVLGDGGGSSTGPHGAGGGRAGLRFCGVPAAPGTRTGSRRTGAHGSSRRGREGPRVGAAADRLRFSRRPAAKLHQPADAPGDPAQADGSRLRRRNAGPAAASSAGAGPGARSACVPAQHAAGGRGWLQPGGGGAAGGRELSERERDSGDVHGRRRRPSACRRR